MYLPVAGNAIPMKPSEPKRYPHRPSKYVLREKGPRGKERVTTKVSK